MFKATSAVLALAVIVAVIYGVALTEERNALNGELKTVQSVLVSTQGELSSTELTLASTQSELSSTEQTLASTQAELGSTELTLASTQSELSSTEQTLASTQSELSSTEQTLASTQAELGSTKQQLAVAQETLGGLGITLYTSKECADVALIDNPTATNPTWSQLIAFISQDQTEKHTYTLGVYDCSQFSRDVHNNAEAAGIRVAEIQVEFGNENVGHALNAFLTTDYGLVYVDCTETDTIARVKAGKEYRAVDLYTISKTNIRNDYWWDTLSPYVYYYIPSSFFSLTGGHSVTESIEIYW